MSQEAPDEPPTKRQKFTPIPEPEPMASAEDIAVAEAAAAAAAAAQGLHRHTSGSQLQVRQQQQQQQKHAQEPVPRPTIVDVESGNREEMLQSDVSSSSDSSLSDGDADIPYSMTNNPHPTVEAPLSVTASTPNGSQNILPAPTSEKPDVRVKTPSTPVPASVIFPAQDPLPGAMPPRGSSATNGLEMQPFISQGGNLLLNPALRVCAGGGPLNNTLETNMTPPDPDHIVLGHAHPTPSKLGNKRASIVPRTPRTPNTPSSATPSNPTAIRPLPLHEHSFNPHRNTINGNASNDIRSNVHNGARGHDNINPNHNQTQSHNQSQSHNHSHNVNHMNSPQPNANQAAGNNGTQSANNLPVSPAQTNPSSVAPSPPNPPSNKPLPPPSTKSQPHRTNPFPHHCYFNIPEKLNGSNLTEVLKAIQEMEAVRAKLRERAAFLEQLGDTW
ncbi:uncharacterized protein ARB_05357 [Trichophyton benhamiae CBS 112371]|uniref:Uncharacterized protein n=1 Tax=Arthroderma benhamiae (strain ATCC MYA-4681 / CBS 112371) TaxID=663331 RepID=D4AM09_ARTBC|nr:uncharacterized protein ARB_05357 [Trichophyton benhamiae CBS 112371]EFE36418.1 hypothetical protein ARB_05357 [Trichophyton benhamiae CBS 112371]